jgi:hypothetical protein
MARPDVIYHQIFLYAVEETPYYGIILPYEHNVLEKEEQNITEHGRYIYSRTRLQRHERDWIFCVVIKEYCYNRGV